MFIKMNVNFIYTKLVATHTRKLAQQHMNNTAIYSYVFIYLAILYTVNISL